MKRNARVLLLAVVGILGITLVPMSVWAQQATSTNYSVDEAFFGTGGELDACSTTYCSRQSAGETAVGNTASTNYQAQGGQNTNREEYLEFTVNASTTDLGILSIASPSTTTGTFSVKSYLTNGGYAVTNASDPPRSGPNTLANLISQTASSAGTEQFGINLVANTSPVSFGANATQGPDATFGFGAAASGYSTTNQYKYVKGDTIASSNRSSGYTNYTISYLYNISNSTKAGLYTFNHIMVATSTY